MSLFKRSDSPYWWVKLSHNGRSLQRSTGTSDKARAQEYHDKLKASLWDEIRLGIKQRRSWKEAVVRWVSETTHKKSHTKDLGYLKWLDKHFGDHDLRDITRDRIDRITQLRKADGVSNATVNRMLAVLRSILRRAAYEWEWIDRAPRVRLLLEPKLRVRFLTQEQAVALLRELPPHVAAMMRFALLTGLRRGNVRDLQWSQIDLENRKLWIHAEQAKGGKAIAVPLTADTVKVLQSVQGQHPSHVFTYQGKPIEQLGTRAWRHALTRAGIKDFRWHDLRHTWASWHAQNGTPQGVLQELGGWESASMVRRYAHFSPQHLQQYADGFGAKVCLDVTGV